MSWPCMCAFLCVFVGVYSYGVSHGLKGGLIVLRTFLIDWNRDILHQSECWEAVTILLEYLSRFIHMGILCSA